MNLKKIGSIVIVIVLILCAFYLLRGKESELGNLWEAKVERKIPATTVIVDNDNPYNVVISTPVALYYESNKKYVEPLVTAGERSNYFLDLYKPEATIKIESSIEKESIRIATTVWQTAEAAILVEYDNYALALTLAPIGSYLNVPIMITNDTKSVEGALKALNVKYTIIGGDLEPYGKSIKINTIKKAQEIVLDIMIEKNLEPSYIVLTNPNDISSEYGIPHISSLAPYLAAGRLGIIVCSNSERLPEDIFTYEDGQKIGNLANITAINVKDTLNDTFLLLKERNLYEEYLKTPYLGILGDPYSIPFYYIWKGEWEWLFWGGETWIVTDDYYSDLDNNIKTVELASGRVLALSLNATSALISRSLTYEKYMQKWTADTMLNIFTGAEWKNTAYLGIGDDWNGAIWSMTPEQLEIYQYLRSNGYTVYTTKSITTGETTAQDILKLYTSSSMIYIMAHGSPSGYNQVDSVTAEDVKEWHITGPSVMLTVSCSAGRTDVEDIQNTISLAFMSVGMNVYIGGTRTESTEGSPYICEYILKNLVDGHKPIGIAHRDAKNRFCEEGGAYYHSGIKELYGDPAFVPYIP